MVFFFVTQNQFLLLNETKNTNHNVVTRNWSVQIVLIDSNTETLDRNRLVHGTNVLIDSSSLLALLHFRCYEMHAMPNVVLSDNLS